MVKIVRLIMAAISIRVMEEKFQEKRLMSSMAMQEPIMMERGSHFFCILRIMVMAASKMSSPTAILIPLKALAIQGISKN